MRNAAAQFQPILKVVAHVVAAERQHGHRIAPRDAERARRRGGCLRSERRADVNAVIPIQCFVNERRKFRSASAKNERRNRDSLIVFPMRRNRRRLSRGHGVARIRMRRQALARRPCAALPIDQARRAVQGSFLPTTVRAPP